MRWRPRRASIHPHDATVIAFANVQDVMNSQLRRKLLQPSDARSRAEGIENQTGINIETTSIASSPA
jgi:hypothetical protein